ncbi:MAG TPA: type II toxin-antitoxin system RelE/ParE family toxin [Thermoanaerobaculia bacterium]|nr:type II toxin-antitoxin system RelE/ParE family toxin [Thermoanaerobaculia bacterium]
MPDRALSWVGTALSDVRDFPEDARRSAGYELRRVQQGLMPTDWKPMSTVGAGVIEIRLSGRLEHRVLYVAKFEEAIYVLHAFPKKTQRTRKADLDLARRRLREVERLQRSGKER